MPIAIRHWLVDGMEWRSIRADIPRPVPRKVRTGVLPDICTHTLVGWQHEGRFGVIELSFTGAHASEPLVYTGAAVTPADALPVCAGTYCSRRQQHHAAEVYLSDDGEYHCVDGYSAATAQRTRR
jgi:hypothetical protein